MLIRELQKMLPFFVGKETSAVYDLISTFARAARLYCRFYPRPLVALYINKASQACLRKHAGIVVSIFSQRS